MAPKLIVSYFDDIAGDAEPLRWALAQSGLEWEDKRLTKEEFGALKPSLPNGQVPILEVDGYVLAQSLAIHRYFGKLGELFPTGDLEGAKYDSVLDCATDFGGNICPSFMEKDQAKKKRRRGADDYGVMVVAVMVIVIVIVVVVMMMRETQMEMREDLAANFNPRWLASMEKQLASTGGVYFAEKITVLTS